MSSRSALASPAGTVITVLEAAPAQGRDQSRLGLRTDGGIEQDEGRSANETDGISGVGFERRGGGRDEQSAVGRAGIAKLFLDLIDEMREVVAACTVRLSAWPRGHRPGEAR